MPRTPVPTVFILDVDGVLTTGQFFYSEHGKVYKVFGPDDNDALSLLSKFIDIRFVTGDKKGFDISKKRIVDDMGFPLDLVSTFHRVEWISERHALHDVIYMGDGIFDPLVMSQVAYSIAPSNSAPATIAHASFVTSSPGGFRAVAEACIHIMSKYFVPFNPQVVPSSLQVGHQWNP